MRLAREILHRHEAAGDLHASMAARLVAEGLLPVLDVGCGEGELQRHLSYGAWVGVDASRRWRRERQEALSWLKPTLRPPRPGRSAPPHCCTSDTTSAIPPVHWPRPGEWCGRAALSRPRPRHRAGLTRLSWPSRYPTER